MDKQQSKDVNGKESANTNSNENADTKTTNSKKDMIYSNDLFEKKKEFYFNFLSFFDSDENVDDDFHRFIALCDNQKFGKNIEEIMFLLDTLSNIILNYHRSPSFFIKIDKILNYFQKSIKKIFSNQDLFNFASHNKLFILLLTKNQILDIDNSISMLISKQPINYQAFFYQEIKPFIDEQKQIEIESFLIQKNPDIFNNFDEKRSIGENDSIICELIRNDSVDDFISHINQTKDPFTKKIESSLFETNEFLIDKNPSLIEYAAFCGSIHIFKYLQLNGVELTPSLWPYAVHSKNAELIHLLEDNQIEPENSFYGFCLLEAIKCSYIDISEYIFNNFFTESNGFCKLFIKYAFIKNLGNGCNIKYKLQYDFFTIVELLFNGNKKTKNIQVRMISNKPTFNDFLIFFDFCDESTIVFSASNSNFDIVNFLLPDKLIEAELLSIDEFALDQIIVPPLITRIGTAFKFCDSLTKIVIPSSVTEIGQYAFYECQSLKEVIFKLPSSCISINKGAFSHCFALEKIEIPPSVLILGDSAFFGCKSLKEIAFSSSIQEIGPRAFCNCASIEKVVLPSQSITEIFYSTFCGCSKLGEFEIPSSVTKIGEAAFYRCNSLKKLEIPQSVNEIGDRIACGCSSLEQISVPSSLDWKKLCTSSKNTSILRI